MKPVSPSLLALGAIALWGTLATLGVSLSHVPPFLLTGLALLVGSLVALPLSGFQLRRWRVPLSTLALGIYGLFGFHFLLFVALRHAPPVQAKNSGIESLSVASQQWCDLQFEPHRLTGAGTSHSAAQIFF